MLMQSLPPNLLLAAGYILATIAGGFALYYWRRSSELYALLVEGANRFEELRSRNAQVENTITAAEKRWQQLNEAAKTHNQDLLEAREKAADLTKKLETKANETRFISEKLELQKGHLEKQLVKLTDQLTALEAAKHESESRLAEAAAQQRQRQSVLEREGNELRERLRAAASALDAAQSEKTRLEKVVHAVDPEELRRLKRKIAQYDRLYSSMRGLREMADERNRNWEVALRKLSGWIIAKGNKNAPSLAQVDTAPIGPLVGQALQAIGAQLIDDNEIMPAHTHESDQSLGLDSETHRPSDLTVDDGMPSHDITLHQVDDVARILRG
jgi:myosin heavy subunit